MWSYPHGGVPLRYCQVQKAGTELFYLVVLYTLMPKKGLEDSISHKVLARLIYFAPHVIIRC